MMRRHAYLIIAHNNWYILSKLVSMLDDKRNDIYIHIDRKSNPTVQLKQTLKAQVYDSRIIFIESRSVSWGGYSLIDVTLKLLTAATEKNHYAYYHLLSGCDLPIRNQRLIHEFFDTNQGAEFIHFGKEDWIERIKGRLEYYYFFQDYVGNSRRIDKLTLKYLDHICVSIQKKIGINRIRNIHVSAGSEWFSITDEFARYVLSQTKFIKKHFKYGACVDESFIQTIAINSTFKQRIYNSASHVDQDCTLRYIQWENGKSHVLKRDDFDRFINSECFFARKFDETDKEFIDDICKMVFGKTISDYSAVERR